MTNSKKFDFSNRAGEMLSGRLEMPVQPQAFAIFAHCFTCSKNVNAASRISRALAARNIAVLRFDFTGLGNSEGDFSNTNYSSNVDDLVFAADALRQQYDAPQLLIGHSLGGTASLLAGDRIEEVRAIATIGSPADPSHVKKLFGDKISEIEDNGSVEVRLAGRPFTIRKQFVDDVDGIDLEPALKRMNKAFIVYHSPQDELVSINHARQIYERLRHPKSFISLEGADHLLSDKKDSEFVAETLVAWANRFLEMKQDSPLVAEGSVLVDQLEGFTHLVKTSRHSMIADEPENVGGADLGMTPYDLLLASLGSCTSMTLKMYAARKQWPLEHVSITLQHDRIHAKDCESCESETGKIDQIRRQITVQGDLDEGQLQRLAEIADRCPVHRTLMNEKEIPTSIELSRRALPA